MQFPEPVRLSPGCTRWRLSELERYEATVSGILDAPIRAPENERYLSVKQVAERYGTSVPSVWRWSKQGRAAA